MNSYVLILVIIFIFIFIFIFSIVATYKTRVIEHFIAGPCPNCGKMNKMQCFGCGDCGWCVTPNGYGECIPGDQNGPYFRQDCVSWQHEPPIPPYPSRLRPRRRLWRWRRFW